VVEKADLAGPPMLAAERWRLIVAALLVLLTRLPWIWHGYGSDPDGYRVVATARALLHGGAYEPSRLPGYPGYEFLSVLTADGPPWTSNLVTALFSVAAFVLLALLLRQLNLRHYLLVAAGFAMVPVIYISSTCTMDYLPSVTLSLGAACALICHRSAVATAVAGLLLGLAIGCRLTAGAMALPLCVWLWLSRPPREALPASSTFGVIALGVAALCFLPVWRIYGTGFFLFYDNDDYPPLDVVLPRGTTQVWGPIGCAALLLAWGLLPWYRQYSRQQVSCPRKRAMLVVALGVCALYAAAFVRLPDEAGYLVPLVPWMLVSLAILAPPLINGLLAAALFLSPWVSFDGWRPALSGPMIEDHAVRESQDAATRAVIEAVRRLPGRATVVCGWVLPRISLALNGDSLGPHQFVYLVDNEDQYQAYLRSGRQIYYIPGVDLYESQARQLELGEHGAQALDVPRERQRPASTGE
jgi:hypothetical protein